jgi:hypothetical protein
MKSLKIDDLETSKDLDEACMKSINGGFGFGNGDLIAPVAGAGGGIFSPQTIVSVPVYAPVNIALDLDTDLGIDTRVANVIASAASGIAQ